MTAKITAHTPATAATAGTLAQRARSAQKPSKINYLRALLTAVMVSGGVCGFCGLSVDLSRVDRDGMGGTVKVDRRRAVGRQVTTPHGPRRDADSYALCHVVPVDMGGTVRPGNVFLGHRACNQAAGTTDLSPYVVGGAHVLDERVEVPSRWVTGRQAADASDPRDMAVRPDDAPTRDDLRAARARRGWTF